MRVWPEMMYRLLQRFWVWRWARALIFAASRVRLHPNAVLIGSISRFMFRRGVKIGARSILDIDHTGRLIVGEDVWISSEVEFQTDTEISIGEGTTIQRRCTINGTVRVGAWCIFAPNIFASSGTHPFRVFPALTIREQEKRIAASKGKSLDCPIWIQMDCWLGINVVVCPGVTIGRGSIVGANSVVTREVQPYSIIAGSPARVIGKRLEWLPLPLIEAAIEDHAIFVLDGTRIKRDDGTFGFVPMNGCRCFVAALSKPQSFASFRIRYRAMIASQIRIAGIEYFVAEGNGSIDVPYKSCEELEFVRFEVEMLLPSAQGCFSISSLGLLPCAE